MQVFALAWDMPLVRFGSGNAYYRRYTKFFGREGTHVQELLARAMAQVCILILCALFVCPLRAHVRLRVASCVHACEMDVYIFSI